MKKLILLSLSLSLALPVFGKVKVDSVKYHKTSGSQAQIVIGYNGNLNTTPELMIRDEIIQVSITGAEVWPQIEKKVSVSGKGYDATLKAYQYNKKVVRFRALLPYSMKGHEGQVNLILKDGQIDLQFPRLKAKVKKPMFAAIKKEKKNDNYDESFLDRLLKDKENIKLQKKEAPEALKMKNKNQKVQKVDEDKVRMALAGTQKTKGKSTFSIANYVGKFVAFLGGMLLIFYLVVNFFKKGVLKKGKLGFLNDTKVVSVLNTTYIGPKKSLIMVKVHNQVMLLGSDDKGLHFISEVKDTTGLIKEGEKSIAGNNFDTSLAQEEKGTKEFKLKEVPTSTEASALTEFLNENPVQDKVKLSDQIKKRVKDLKPLQ